MPISDATYHRMALEDDLTWELYEGRPRAKSTGTWDHNDAMGSLGFRLADQLPRPAFHFRINAGRVRRGPGNYYVPDVMVMPDHLTWPLRGLPEVLEVYDDPLPFVAEVWDPPHEGYDGDDKLPEYRRRGDAEIWRPHPFDRTLTVWRRQPDGSYEESFHRGGVVPVRSLPGVTIDLDALFD